MIYHRATGNRLTPFSPPPCVIRERIYTPTFFATTETLAPLHFSLLNMHKPKFVAVPLLPVSRPVPSRCDSPASGEGRRGAVIRRQGREKAPREKEREETIVP